MDETRVNEIRELVKDIQGWCAGGPDLYDLVRNWPSPPVVVELGSWKGLSTAWLGLAIKDRGGGRLVAVDTWEGTASERVHREMLKDYGPDGLFTEFTANMEKLGIEVEAFRGTTKEGAEWWRGPIDILHIDAAHDYKCVREDFERWSPHARLIVFDDVPGWPGPSRVIQELPRWWRYAGSSNGKWYVSRE